MSADRVMPRRPADSPDVCARPGCGKSLAGRFVQAKFCGDKCKDKRGARRKK